MCNSAKMNKNAHFGRIDEEALIKCTSSPSVSALNFMAISYLKEKEYSKAKAAQ